MAAKSIPTVTLDEVIVKLDECQNKQVVEEGNNWPRCTVIEICTENPNRLRQVDQNYEGALSVTYVEEVGD